MLPQFLFIFVVLHLGEADEEVKLAECEFSTIMYTIHYIH